MKGNDFVEKIIIVFFVIFVAYANGCNGGIAVKIVGAECTDAPETSEDGD